MIQNSLVAALIEYNWKANSDVSWGIENYAYAAFDKWTILGLSGYRWRGEQNWGINKPVQRALRCQSRRRPGNSHKLQTLAGKSRQKQENTWQKHTHHIWQQLCVWLCGLLFMGQDMRCILPPGKLPTNCTKLKRKVCTTVWILKGLPYQFSTFPLFLVFLFGFPSS